MALRRICWMSCLQDSRNKASWVWRRLQRMPSMKLTARHSEELSENAERHVWRTYSSQQHQHHFPWIWKSWYLCMYSLVLMAWFMCRFDPQPSMSIAKGPLSHLHLACLHSAWHYPQTDIGISLRFFWWFLCGKFCSIIGSLWLFLPQWVASQRCPERFGASLMRSWNTWHR